MELKEVLAEVPGLEKRFVYYLESLGYIQPRRVPKRRIDRRDYSASDVERIRGLWRYYQRGYALQAAQELAARPRHCAYALLQLPSREQPAACAALAALPEVRAVHLLYGAPADALVVLDGADESEVYEALSRLLTRGSVLAAPEVLHVARSLDLGPAVPASEEGMPSMQAFVLIKLPAKQIESVLADLRAILGIVEASVIYGETDVIAKVEVASQAELDHLIFRQLQAMPAVESTRTFIVVGDLHWGRA